MSPTPWSWLCRHRGWPKSTWHLGLACYPTQRAELGLGGVGGMARQTRHAAYPRRALSSDDTGEDRALASDAQEPHPTGELLSARPARGSDPSCWKEKGSNAKPSNTDACITKLTQRKIKPNVPRTISPT